MDANEYICHGIQLGQNYSYVSSALGFVTSSIVVQSHIVGTLWCSLPDISWSFVC